MARRSSGLEAGHYLREYESITKAVRDSLRAYLGEPNDRNTHVLRRHLRRLDAALRVLPKRARGEEKSLDRYQRRCRKLLRATSRVRDLDMIARRLRAEGTDASLAAIVKKVKTERRKEVADSMKAAWKLFETKAPKLEAATVAGVDTQARRVIADLDEEVEKDLSRTTASESRVDELHSLRKGYKKLRYTFELMPPGPERDERSRALHGWQDALGAIRDSDVLIERLGSEEPNAVTKEVIREEKLKRHRRYVGFLRSYNRRPEPGRRAKRSSP